VEARGPCPGDSAGCQVLADEAQSGQVAEAWMDMRRRLRLRFTLHLKA